MPQILPSEAPCSLLCVTTYPFIYLLMFIGPLPFHLPLSQDLEEDNLRLTQEKLVLLGQMDQTKQSEQCMALELNALREVCMCVRVHIVTYMCMCVCVCVTVHES